MKNTTEATVTRSEVEDGRPVVCLPVYLTGDIAVDTDAKFAALESFRKASGNDVEPEQVEWLEIRIHEGKK